MPARQVGGLYVRPSTTDRSAFYYCHPEVWNLEEHRANHKLDCIAQSHLRRYGSAGLVMETEAGVDAQVACAMCQRDGKQCRLDVDALDEACAYCYFMAKPSRTCDAVPPEPRLTSAASGIASHLTETERQRRSRIDRNRKRKRNLCHERLSASSGSEPENRSNDAQMQTRLRLATSRTPFRLNNNSDGNIDENDGMLIGESQASVQCTRTNTPYTPKSNCASQSRIVGIDGQSAVQARVKRSDQTQDQNMQGARVDTISGPENRLYRWLEDIDSRAAQLEAKREDGDNQIPAAENIITDRTQTVLDSIRTPDTKQAPSVQRQKAIRLERFRSRLIAVEKEIEKLADLPKRVEAFETTTRHLSELQAHVEESKTKNDLASGLLMRVEFLEKALLTEKQQRLDSQARVDLLEASLQTVHASGTDREGKSDSSDRKHWLIGSYFA